ncbi:SufE family protein [Candidatus Bandiella numerosa]|jgi:cysteine desulfuration protein SufE|uniref:SufE family protein n=1 Tax=Candidatus Bandiella numerosa TaxID=2570586 RepID=UPI00249F53E0|nr:SufE family protein [Candidatus Bandiella numerosa]WHA05350.1 SufE family protein [Candidatus Bandiella numerosa]
MNKEIKQLIDEFELFDDWEEKYSYIIELGKTLPKLNDDEKVEKNKVSGCVSQVWLTSREEDGKLFFYADSDALIVKGLLAIVIKIFSDKTRIEIQNINFMDIFNQLDLKNHLSQSRSNGLFSVISKIRDLR